MVISTAAALGAAGISALGSLGTGALSGFLGSASSKRQYHWQRDLMHLQAELNYEYGRKSAKKQYSWQRQGLEKAGYNPLLALGGAEGVANTGWTSAQSAPDPDYEQSLNTALSWLNNRREQKLADSQVDVNDEQIKNIKTDTQIKENQRDLASLDLYDKDLQSKYYEQLAQINFDNQIIDNKIKHETLTQAIITSKNLDRKQKAEILQMLSASDSFSANAFFNRNRALGFTESYSESDSHSEYGHGASFGLKHDRSKTKSYSHTR